MLYTKALRCVLTVVLAQWFHCISFNLFKIFVTHYDMFYITILRNEFFGSAYNSGEKKLYAFLYKKPFRCTNYTILKSLGKDLILMFKVSYI